ncbi:enoyl-CoA hydratase-related protein [Nocardia sp. R16R-3T]
MSGSAEVLVGEADGVLTLRLDRPRRGNALTPEVVAELNHRVDAAMGDPSVRVVVLTGTPGVFCTGADLGNREWLDRAGSEALLHDVNGLVTRLVELPRPVVAAVDGAAIGVGVSLALACDLLLVSARTRFRLGFSGVGLMPDGGAAALLAASVGRARAQRMVLLDEELDAQALVDCGLTDRVRPVPDFEKEVATVASRLARGPAVALAQALSVVNEVSLTALPASFEREVGGQLDLMDRPDFDEGVRSFVEGRVPQWRDEPPLHSVRS